MYVLQAFNVWKRFIPAQNVEGSNVCVEKMRVQRVFFFFFFSEGTFRVRFTPTLVQIMGRAWMSVLGFRFRVLLASVYLMIPGGVCGLL